MHLPIPDIDTGLTLAFTGIGMVSVVFAGCLVRSWWRSKHPQPPPETRTTYSRRLASRFGRPKRGKPPHG